METKKSVTSFNHAQMKEILNKARILGNSIDHGEVVVGYINALSSFSKVYGRNQKDEFLLNEFDKDEVLIEFLFEKVAVWNLNKFLATKEQHPEIPEISEILGTKFLRTKLSSHTIYDIYKFFYIPETVKVKIVEKLPENPWEAFPETRKMKRKFIVHVGGTNTGKTYSSIERLKEAKSGAYLGPLRLLALEIQEKLNEANVPCNLITGEERCLVAGANHVASTVEMANYNREYEVCVIDECQMMSDDARGGNWVDAIIGIKAKEVHVCVAPEGLKLLLAIIKDLGDEVELNEHERKVPLLFESLANNFNLKRNLKQGDALIVFSKNSALSLGEELKRNGITSSIVYGALPHSTRKAQIARFLSGESTVVIATDAIGMGLNLPIHRIIFMETEKFDGKEKRLLKDAEIKQIAGRAGRYLMYDEGIVSSTKDGGIISRAIKAVIRPNPWCYLNFPESLLDVDGDIVDIIKTWKSIDDKDKYIKQDIKRLIDMLMVVKNCISDEISKKLRYDFVTIAFDEDNRALMAKWIAYCREYIKMGNISYPEMPKENTLDVLETAYKMIDLYYSFIIKFNLECDDNKVKEDKERIAMQINDLIIAMVQTKKKLPKSKP